MFDTYIVIITYNAMPWLNKCLKSIDFKHFKVVVVDNNSNDKTVSFIREFFPSVILLKQDKNLGFGQANNLGISYALKQGATQVFLLNQDAYLVNNALQQLVDFQIKNPEYGILSPVHTNAEKTKLDRNFSYYMQYDNNPYFYSDHVFGNHSQTIYSVPFVNAAGWLIHKDCLMTVGGFDPLFFHYGEDDNYCQRVNYHGFKVGVLSKSYLIHDREHRQKPKVDVFSEDYFSSKLRNFKVRYANPNTFEISKITTYKKKIIKQAVKALFTLKFKNAIQLVTYYQKVLKTSDDIENSVRTNKTKQPSYLDI